MKQGKLNILLGGMIGSEGKGLVASYLGWHNHIDIAIANSSPNAGHTFYIGDKKHITRHLPTHVFLNFANYINDNELNTLLDKLPEVTHVCYGPKIEDVIRQ